MTTSNGEWLQYSYDGAGNITQIVTGYTDLQSVTDAINHGAIYKFLTKPWDDDQLREQIREAFRMAHLNEEQSFSENSGEP